MDETKMFRYDCPRCGREHVADDLREEKSPLYVGPIKVSQVVWCPVTGLQTFLIDETGFDV